MLLPLVAFAALLPVATITVNTTDSEVDGDGCTAEHCSLPEALAFLDGGKPIEIQFELRDGEHIIELDELFISTADDVVLRADPKAGIQLHVAGGTTITGTPRNVVIDGLTFTAGTASTECLAITTSRAKISIINTVLGTKDRPCGGDVDIVRRGGGSFFVGGGLRVTGTDGGLQLKGVEVITVGDGIVVSGMSDVVVADVEIAQLETSAPATVGLSVVATTDVTVGALDVSGGFPSGEAVFVQAGGEVTVRGLRLVGDFAPGVDAALLRGVAVIASTIALNEIALEGIGGGVGIEINGEPPADLTRPAKVQIDGVRIGIDADGAATFAPARGITVATGTDVTLRNITIGNTAVAGLDLFNGGTLLTSSATVVDSSFGIDKGVAQPIEGTGISATSGTSIRLDHVVVAHCNSGLNITVDTLELSSVDIGVVVDGEAHGNASGAHLDVATKLTLEDTFIAGNAGGGVQLHRMAIDTDMVVGLARDGSVVGNGTGAGVVLVSGGIASGELERGVSVPVFRGRVVGKGATGLLALASTVDGAVIGALEDGTAAGTGLGIDARGAAINNVRVVNNSTALKVSEGATVTGGVFIDNDAGVLVAGAATFVDVEVGVEAGRIAVNGGGPALTQLGFDATVLQGGHWVGGGVDSPVLLVPQGRLVVEGATRLGDVNHRAVAAVSAGGGDAGIKRPTAPAEPAEPAVPAERAQILGLAPAEAELPVAVVPGTGLTRRGAVVELEGAELCGVDVGVTVVSSSGSQVDVGDIGLRDGVPCGVGTGVQVVDPDGDEDATTFINVRGRIFADGTAVHAEDIAGIVQISLAADAELQAPVGLLMSAVGTASLDGVVAGRGAVRLLDSTFVTLDVEFALAGIDDDGVVIAGCELPAFALVRGSIGAAAGTGLRIGDGTFMTPTPGRQTFLNIEVSVDHAAADGAVIALTSTDPDDVLDVQLVSVDNAGDGITLRGDVANMQLGGVSSRNGGDGVVLDTDGFVDVNGLFSGARLTPLFGDDFGRDVELFGNTGHGVRCTGDTAAQLVGVSSGNNGIAGLRVEDGCTITGIAGSQFGGIGGTRTPNAAGGIVIVDSGAVVAGDVAGLEGELAGLVGALGDGFNCFVQHNRGNGITTIGDGALFVPGPLLVVADNTGLEIDVGGDGRTDNDADDTDGILNRPVITSVVVDLIDVEIHGIVGRGQTVHLYRSKSRAGDGEPFDHIASFVEGSTDDEDGGGGVGGLGGFGALTPATFVFRLPLSGVPAVAIATDGTRSSEPSDIFFLDPCLPSTLADGCDLDRDGVTNGDERATGTNIFLADSDGDGLSDEQEGDADADDDGLLDALEHNFTDADSDGRADAFDVVANDACLPDVGAGGCDSDGDGLSNADEEIYGTDRDVADTDGDGIPDGFEAALDSDGDGLSNAVESSVGDVDNDGVPDQRDPVELAPECLSAADDEVLRETVVLDTDDDVRAFNDSGVTCIVGNLLVGDAVTLLVLDSLTVVTGRIVIGESDVENVELTVLVRAGSFELEENDSLLSASLPAISTIDGDLRVVGNDRLTLLDIRALRRVGGSVVITDNGSLGRLSAPALEDVGDDVIIDGNPDLGDVDFSGLTTVGGSLTITDNDSLTSIDAGDLQSVGGSLTIAGNEAVDDVDLGGLTTVGGSLTITDVSADADIGLGNLQEVGGDVVVEGDAGLPAGWVCVDGVCAAACGDGIILGDERCDDGNDVDGDGCAAVCTIEPGYLCAVDGDGVSVCVSADALNAKPEAVVAGGCQNSAAPPLFVVLIGLMRRRRSFGVSSR